ncbi:MAG TPA: type II and III secretion system protein family protein [Solimonas sp.]
MNTVLLRVLQCCLVALLCATSPAFASSQAPVLLIEQGTHKLHRSKSEVARVAVGSPEIADVNVINRRDLLISGRQLGVTSLMIWTKGADRPLEFRLRVVAAVDPLKSSVPDKELSGAQIDAGRSLEGRLPNLMAHRRAQQAAQAAKEGQIVDRSGVDLESQVMTQVKIAEVTRSTLQRYGLNVLVNRGTTGGIVGPGGLGGVSQNTDGSYTISGASGFVPLRDAFNLVVGDTSKNILGILSLLEGQGLARTLAEPSLVATSGQTATYLAGGEFPVPVSQGGATSGGISIEYKEFGVRLSLSPTVLSRNRIALKVAPEVSDLDFSAGIQVGGVSVPALTVRRTDTTIELGDGESFLISGLVSSTMANNVNKVPWLGDIPVLGAFFKSLNVQREDKELIMVVTPNLVRPLARGARQPKLPGSEYDRNRPSIGYNVFLENGEFDAGFSR